MFFFYFFQSNAVLNKFYEKGYSKTKKVIENIAKTLKEQVTQVSYTFQHQFFVPHILKYKVRRDELLNY